VNEAVINQDNSLLVVNGRTNAPLGYVSAFWLCVDQTLTSCTRCRRVPVGDGRIKGVQTAVEAVEVVANTQRMGYRL
jgi:hypothetical protein